MEHDDPLDREGGEDSRAGEGQDPIDWEKIKHDFIYGDWSLVRIAELRGSSESTISRRAKREGWVRLVGTKCLRSGPKPNPPGTPKPKPKTAAQRRRIDMVQRLFEVLDAKMREIEERMVQANSAGANAPSAADAERDTRALNAIARLYAKLVELDEAARKDEAKQGSDTPPTTRSDDADQLRRDLALRLQRLDRGGDA
jgi:hypothetical protein